MPIRRWCYRGASGDRGTPLALLSNILGLDLGSHSLKAVELRPTLRGFEPVSMHTLAREGDRLRSRDLAAAPVARLATHRRAIRRPHHAPQASRSATARSSARPFRTRWRPTHCSISTT
jgi:hypothetical protein